MVRPTITLDFETRSYADLPKVGAWAYSEDPTTDVICAAWGIDDAPVVAWTPLDAELCTGPLHQLDELYYAIEDGALVEAHNVSFEYSIWKNIMVPKYGAPEISDENWRDTMAAAGYYALPMKLDRLAAALGYQGKDPEGGRLISKYSKLYLKTAKTVIPQEDLAKFIAYCVKDVEIEQSISDYLGPLPDAELEIFLLDQRVNKRGLLLDVKGIDVAAKLVDGVAAELSEELQQLTKCEKFPRGLGPGQVAKILEWCELHGTKLDNLQKTTLADMLDGDDEELLLPEGLVRDVLTLRQDVAKASTRKLDAMARNVGRDGRARFQSRYHGAQTGRQTGTGFQPLNLSKGYEDLEPDQLVRDIMLADAKYLAVVYGAPMDAIGKASRHWIQAKSGWKIIAGDFVSIEAVALACTAYEEWKVKAFKEKQPLYALMGCKIHNIPEIEALTLGDKGFKAKYPKQRFDGKTGELAFGYQGAVGAWRKFDRSNTHTDERIVEICKAWRGEHPNTVDYWYALQDASIEAVLHPGRSTYVNDMTFKMIDEWLSLRLPDGKRIWYYTPEIRLGWPQWHKPAEKEKCAAGICGCEKVPKLYYRANKEGQWRWVSTYGGKNCENATQGVSRQILFPAMLELDRVWGEPLRQRGLIKPWESVITLSVYDEIVCEVPEDFADAHDFEEIVMNRLAQLRWMDGWPVSVEVWEGGRYKK